MHIVQWNCWLLIWLSLCTFSWTTSLFCVCHILCTTIFFRPSYHGTRGKFFSCRLCNPLSMLRSYCPWDIYLTDENISAQSQLLLLTIESVFEIYRCWQKNITCSCCSWLWTHLESHEGCRCGRWRGWWSVISQPPKLWWKGFRTVMVSPKSFCRRAKCWCCRPQTRTAGEPSDRAQRTCCGRHCFSGWSWDFSASWTWVSMF